MKYKGKIIQIIEEKKSREYVLSWQQEVLPNFDFLNIRPAEERAVPFKFKLPLFICLGICIVCATLSFIFNFDLSAFISVVCGLSLIYIGNKIIEYDVQLAAVGLHDDGAADGKVDRDAAA